MIFNQDIATTALSITILEGFAGIFSNSSKGFLNSWSLTTPISYSVRYKEDTLWKVFRICLHFSQEEAKSNAFWQRMGELVISCLTFSFNQSNASTNLPSLFRVISRREEGVGSDLFSAMF